MKRNLLTTMVVLFALLNVNAANKVPAEVTTAFKAKFPTATEVRWDMETKTEWEAEFKLDGKSYSANFDLKGNWKETEYKIALKDIPAAIMAKLKKAGDKILAAEVSETHAGKIYEVVVLKNNKKTERCFDEAGNEKK